MALPWTTRSVAHNKKLLRGESAALWANASRMLLYCEVSMNNIKALPGCFCGSRHLGQTLAIIMALHLAL